MIRAEVNSKAVMVGLDRLPMVVIQALEKKIRQQANDLAAYVVAFKLQGQVLKHRTGALGRSIQSEAAATGEVVKGRVFSAGDVKYARIHEYGGVIHHPGGTAYILEKTGLAKFVSNAAAGPDLPRTKPHDITMPQRSYMRTSLADKRDEIIAGIEGVATKAAREAMGK